MINVNHLIFTYTKAPQPALRGLDFAVEPGEIFGFLGPSGAGKSTTQKILIGLLKGYEGAVTVLGKDLAHWGGDYYERIGVSFETPNHYLKLTALENLAYFRSLYNRATQDPKALLETVNLAGDGDMLVSQFSKGMKNRLSVARSLLHNPELVFMDEPTAGLDPVNARRIKDLIQAQKHAGRTVFLTTHDMMIADELCDRVAFIVDGEIKLIDAPRALKLRYGQRRVCVEYGGDGRVDRGEFPLDRLGDNAEFLQLLRTRDVQTIHTQEATLEDIFIQVTGRSLS
ncbi:MAG: ABC transporter ATP-binding protein [Chloroflexi bacterium]|nr:ABC transporter ATP-binding protein [Chloroflexota bacterium]